MSLRQVASRVIVAAAATAAAGTFVAVAAASPAGAASSPQQGTEIGTTQTTGSFTPGTPYDSGQLINVVVPPNTVFDGSVYLNNNTAVKIVECSAPNGVIPSLTTACDGNTIATDFPNGDGSLNYVNDTGTSGYPVYFTPNSSIGDSPGGPACGNTSATECILYIGNNQNDFTAPHVWSEPFFVHSDPNNTGTLNPGDGTPEVPMAIVLPLAALGLLGGAVGIRRRRAARSADA